MIFHSLDFLAFFVVVLALYWRLPHRAQNVLLLVASYVFYGWVHPWFLILIAASTVVDYWSALRMEADPDRKRWYLWVSLASNLGMLGFFKYYGFFVENVRAVAALAGLDVSAPTLAIVLPVGISFYTFQTLSYTVDVYRGHLQARRNFVDFSLFVSFFPQLVAGPIERATHLLPQVEQPRRWDAEAARDAVVLITWGFLKKLVVADNVGVIANRVFAMQDPAFEILWAGVFAFGLQIYADFSAYSDIARGISRLLGFDLMRNFDHPYIAHSPTDFWRRWHISLSTWFRDYVYIPLGGSRVAPLAARANLVVTFLVSGLWHGASWNFVLWGLYHGLLVVVTRQVGNWLRLPEIWPGPLAVVQIACTWVAMMGGWLLFRETNPEFLAHFLNLRPWSSVEGEAAVGLHLFVLAATWGLPLFIDDLWALARERGLRPVAWAHAHVTGWPLVGAQAISVGAMLALVLVLRSRTSLDFIYFQF